MIEANLNRFRAAQNLFGGDDVFGPRFARNIGQRQHVIHSACHYSRIAGGNPTTKRFFIVAPAHFRAVPKISKKADFLIAIQNGPV
jgi:hypothetical protein